MKREGERGFKAKIRARIQAQEYADQRAASWYGTDQKAQSAR